MKSERDELAKEVMKATLGCPPGPNALLGHGTLAGRCYALADAMLAEAAKGKEKRPEDVPEEIVEIDEDGVVHPVASPPGYGENDLTVPFRVVLYIRKVAKGCADIGNISDARVLRTLATELESLKAADLPDGEPPLDGRTLEAAAEMLSQAGYDNAPKFVRGMAQKAKGDG